jgi:hypothetical protein
MSTKRCTSLGFAAAWFVAAIAAAGFTSGDESSGAPMKLAGLRVVSAEAASKSFSGAQNAVDGDPKTEFTFAWGNGGASLVIDFGGPRVIETALVTNGQTNQLTWVQEIAVGPDPEHLRSLLGRAVNLPMWRGGDTAEIPLPPAAARFVRIAFAGGGDTGAIGEVAFLGHENRPERHLMCWSGDIKRDFLDKMDYLDRDLGATDLWLDFVEGAFPQSNRNSGFQVWKDSGALKEFTRRGIRYWLGEHEAFTTMVNAPADLRDDLRWETTFRQMRFIYAQARALGFRGLVLDAEDYDGVTDAAKERYQEAADFVDAWAFADEFGPSGMYYQRGLEFGRVLQQVWGCPMIQVYEARAYAGKDDCRAGNYWWLKGIHDAGIEIWIATERTYGAGSGEIADPDSPEHLGRWFVRLEEYLPRIHQAYPFAARVLPGFHPWNTRTRKPNYLPRYLDEQLRIAADCALGYWIYNEGNSRAGDPREVLDREFCATHGVTPEDYLRVFARHPTPRTKP